MKNFFGILAIVLMFSSCISTKSTTYFQGDPKEKSSLYRLTNEPYRLQVNDILFIDIKSTKPELVELFKRTDQGSFGGDAYFSGYTVNRHGNIRIPQIGALNVLGYTEDEVRLKIEEQLLNYLKDDQSFFVSVKLAGISFVVTGEVGSPGNVSLNQNEVTIIDAIANAGELGEFGDPSKVQIFRKTLDGIEKHTIDMTSIDVFESEHFYIKPHDVVYVPAIKQKSWGTGRTGFESFSTLISIVTFVASSVLLVKNL